MTKQVRPELVPPAEGQRHKRFRLSIVGADEDVPRLVRAYGRACDGEFGLVMRPPELGAVLVLVPKDGSAFFWKGDQVDKDDSPLKPILKTSAADAVSMVRNAQKSPPKVGPVTLRGRWTGYLYCEGGQPRVELKRKLATYGTLWVFSNGSDGWTWSFERSEKWFGDAGQTEGKGGSTLQEAIRAAVLGAMQLVREACSFRDTRRRAAHDEEYAGKHPIRKREPKRDPTERLKEPTPKKPRRSRKAAAAPKASPPKAQETARKPKAAPPAPLAPKPTRRRAAPKAKAPAAAAASTAVDADKDKALIDAFSAAFAAVLGEDAA